MARFGHVLPPTSLPSFCLMVREPTEPTDAFLRLPFEAYGETRATPVEFIAYTPSAMLNATFELLDSRLSDALNAGRQFRLVNVTRTTLESMMTQEFGQLGVSRQDLVAVHAT